MEFSHLFILQLKSWLYGLGPLDLNSELDLCYLLIFDLLIFDLLLSNFCIPQPFMLEPTLQTVQAL